MIDKLNSIFDYDPITDRWFYKNFVMTLNGLNEIKITYCKYPIKTLLVCEEDIRPIFKKPLDWIDWFSENVSPPTKLWDFYFGDFKITIYHEYFNINYLNAAKEIERVFKFDFNTEEIKKSIKKYISNEGNSYEFLFDLKSFEYIIQNE